MLLPWDLKFALAAMPTLCGVREREAEIKGIAYPRHHLVVNDFDIERLRAFLDGYARQCVGETWQEVAVKLARLGRWEFDDYVP